jgi:DNA polymerase-1
VSPNPLVLFDASYLAHRARHSTGGLSHGGVATGIVYGFLEAVRSICSDPRIASNRVGICFDSRSRSFRRESFPGYKQRRHADRTPEEVAAIAVMHEQMEMLRRELLPAVGFPVYYQAGVESDDLLAQAARQECPPNGSGRRSVIVTADGDLYQAITNDVHWFDPSRDVYLTDDRFWVLKGLWPSDWATVKEIAGCSGDEVPGVGGVGEATAIKYVLKEPITDGRRAKIESPGGVAIRRRNSGLVRLPHLRTKEIAIHEPLYNPRELGLWSARFGFASYFNGPRARAWENFFAGTFSGTSRQIATARTRR